MDTPPSTIDQLLVLISQLSAEEVVARRQQIADEDDSLRKLLGCAKKAERKKLPWDGPPQSEIINRRAVLLADDSGLRALLRIIRARRPT